MLTLLDLLHSKAPIGLGYIDRNYRIVRSNDHMAAASGQLAQSQIGRLLPEILAPEVWQRIEPLCRRALDDGLASTDVGFAGPAADGSLHHWRASYYPVEVKERIVGVGVVLTDVTDSVEAEHRYRRVMHGAINAMAETVEARDPYTAGHQRRVAEMAVAIASDIGLSPEEIAGVDVAARIHDIGKLAVPAEILSRPGELRPGEFELVKAHARVGYDIVADIPFPWPVATMVLQHHERLDGSGYPSGLIGEEIIVGSRIIAVADTVEALMSHRPYRPSRGMRAAIAAITDGRGTRYDPDVVDACVNRLQGNGQ